MRAIDADALYKVFMAEMEQHPMPETPGLGRYRAQVWREAAGFFITMLMKAPTIDAKPVRPGRWIDAYCGKYANAKYICSCCGKRAHSDDWKWELSDFCPHCGAKMDGGGDK